MSVPDFADCLVTVYLNQLLNFSTVFFYNNKLDILVETAFIRLTFYHIKLGKKHPLPLVFYCDWWC